MEKKREKTNNIYKIDKLHAMFFSYLSFKLFLGAKVQTVFDQKKQLESLNISKKKQKQKLFF